MPYCPKCGREVAEDMNVCPYCGNPLKGKTYGGALAPRVEPTLKVSIGTKNPGLGAILSLIPGLGQMYAGKIGRGLLFLIFGIPVTVFIAFLLFWLILPLFFPLAFWLWNIFDAYYLCREYNRLLIQSGNPPW